MRRAAEMKSILLMICAVATMLGAIGCNSEKPQSESQKNLQALVRLYGRSISQNRGVGPSSEADFKKFIRSLPPETLQSMGVDSANVDKIFTSPRDSEPYGIAWKVSGGVPGPGGAGSPMIIWEQKGVNGKRYVADFLGKIEEVDEATFNQRLANVKK